MLNYAMSLRGKRPAITIAYSAGYGIDGREPSQCPTTVIGGFHVFMCDRRTETLG